MLNRIRNFLSGDSRRRDIIEDLGALVASLHKKDSEWREGLSAALAAWEAAKGGGA